MRQLVRAVVRLGPLLLATACGMQPFDPPAAGEPRPGPGLFSGPDGVFVLYGPDRTQPTDTRGRPTKKAAPTVVE